MQPYVRQFATGYEAARLDERFSLGLDNILNILNILVSDGRSAVAKRV